MAKIKYPRFIILGLLGLEPMSGYDIKKWVDMSFRYFWEIGYGQIYPTLRTLEEEGLVTMRVDHEDGGPEKKIYTISDQGLKDLKTWLYAPEQKECEILLKLFFGDKISPHVLREKVLAFRNHVEENFRAIQNVEEYIGSLPESYGPKPYFRMVSSCGISAYENQLKWADSILQALDQLIKERPISEFANPVH